MSGFRLSCLYLTFLSLISIPLCLSAQAPKKATPVPKSRVAKKAPSAVTSPEILSNEAIIRMVAVGLDEETIVAKINSSPADFRLDTNSLITLKEAKVPSRVLRAMLNRKSPAAQTPAAQPVTTDPGPAVPLSPAPEPVNPIPSPLEGLIARQGTSTFSLTDRPQKVMFIKSEASDAKAAIANIVLSDVGLQLLTMGMSSQMMMWNPYFGDTVAKAANLGKGMLLNRGSDTKGFEIETLPGLTADVTLKEGIAEFFVPINRYLPSANVDPAAIEPVVVRLQARDNESSRVLSGRKVILKEKKKGRFDLKPTTDRVESEVEQSLIPITVERLPDNVFRIATKESLTRGEYALVFRKKDTAGVYTGNVPLRPSSRTAGAGDAPAAPAASAAMPGLTPEMMAMMSPEQVQAMQQQMQQGQAAQSRGGMFGRRRSPAPTAQAVPPGDGSIAGFLAWDFRVIP